MQLNMTWTAKTIFAVLYGQQRLLVKTFFWVGGGGRAKINFERTTLLFGQITANFRFVPENQPPTQDLKESSGGEFKSPSFVLS